MTSVLNDPAMLEMRLPWPPSVNAIWRTHGKAARLSEAARAYFRSAATAIAVQRAGRRFLGRVAVEIVLHAPNKRADRDIDNRAKALLDACTKGGLWDDDSQVDVLIVLRSEIREGGLAVVRVAELSE